MAPGKPNNIEVVKDWSMLIRLYALKSVEDIMKYMKDARKNIRIDSVKE